MTHSRPAIHQRGIALVVALIFLVVLTLLGIAALGNNTLQTRMAYGSSESNVAFQFAETGLSAGENWLSTAVNQPLAGCADPCPGNSANATLIWPRPKTGTPPVSKTQFFDEKWWSDPGKDNGRLFGYIYQDGVTPAAVAGQVPTSSETAAPPRYVIEELGPDLTGSVRDGIGRTYQIIDYQVTARGYGVQAETRTVTQSVYGKGF